MKYKLFSTSLPGIKYSQKGLDCQDHAGNAEIKDIQIVAVADGHGSSDCFRSEIGSYLAVETVIKEGLTWLKGKGNVFSEVGIKQFKYNLWQAWCSAVKADWEEHSRLAEYLGQNEKRYESVSDKYKERYASPLPEIQEKYLYTAYGTTLLCAISIGTQILLLQIGDGTCVVLQKNGLFTTPVPVEENNFLNVTTSLCEADADKKMRHVVLDCNIIHPTLPLAVFLSSDGLDDCFPYWKNEEHLFKFYKLLMDAVINKGFDNLGSELKNIVLPQMSAKGSHDDISLGCMVVDDWKLLKNGYEKINLPQSKMEEETANDDMKSDEAKVEADTSKA